MDAGPLAMGADVVSVAASAVRSSALSCWLWPRRMSMRKVMSETISGCLLGLSMLT